MNEIKPYQKRLLQEHKELRDRLDKLVDFTKGEQFDKLDAMQKHLLLIQLASMSTYANVLTTRLDYEGLARYVIVAAEDEEIKGENNE